MANVDVRREPTIAPPLRWRELWLKEDWWAIWLGLGIVLVAYAFFASGGSIKWIAVTPAKWSSWDQLGAHFAANYDRYIVQFAAWLVAFSIALTALGHKARDFVPSFTALYVLSVAIFALGQWDRASTYNLEPPLVALVVGLLLSNLIGLPRWLDAGFRVEFYIKTGIVLLGATLPFTLILWAGPVAILQASIVSIVTFLVIYWVAVRLGLDRRLAATLGAGGAVCGVSAAIAIAGAVGAKKEDAPIAITTVIIWADGDDLRAAVRSPVPASVRGRRRRLDRHLGIRRCGRLCRGADLRQSCQPRRCRRHQRPGGVRLHADKGRRPRRLDRHLGVRAGDHRNHQMGAGRDRPQGGSRARSGGASRNSSSAFWWRPCW